MTAIEMIIFNNEEEYRKLYNDVFVGNPISFHSIPVLFHIDDFEHIFFEPTGNGNYRFSKRRAKRMLFIKAILKCTVNTDLMYQEDRGTFAVFCEDLECVVYLRPRPGSGRLQIGTFFDFGKNHEKMYLKQKKKCIPIAPQDIINKL